jgi:hypothetical protein
MEYLNKSFNKHTPFIHDKFILKDTQRCNSNVEFEKEIFKLQNATYNSTPKIYE